MAQRLEAHGNVPLSTGISLWVFALSTVVLAGGSILIILWSPAALALALIVGFLAIVSRAVFVRIRETSRRRAEASTVVANAGLTLAAIAIAPLLAFAALWAALLLFLGVTWVLTAVGVA
jgi:hypothetical protein